MNVEDNANNDDLSNTERGMIYAATQRAFNTAFGPVDDGGGSYWASAIGGLEVIARQVFLRKAQAGASILGIQEDDDFKEYIEKGFSAYPLLRK